MKVLELFSGTRSIGEAFEKRGHEVFSVEWDESLPADLHADIEFLKAPDVLRAFGRPDVVWASPDCATFSMAGISRHRRKNANTGNLDPVSDYALKCDRVDLAMLRLIRDLRPALYFIENPRAGLRKQDMMAVIPRHTVTYCQYGARAMKPTDIFTNASDPRFRPPCRNGAPCHESAPRGSKSARRAWRTRASAGASPRGCACTSLTCASARCPSERRRGYAGEKRGSSAARRLHRRRRGGLLVGARRLGDPRVAVLGARFRVPLHPRRGELGRQRQMRKAPHQTRRRARGRLGRRGECG